MIPQGAFMVCFKNGEERIEVSAMAVSHFDITFRILSDYGERLFLCDRVVLNRFDIRSKKYVTLSLDDFDLIKEYTKEELGVNVYKISSESADFLEFMKVFISELISFTKIKLSDEFDAMSEYAGISLSQEFCTSLTQWKKELIKPMVSTELSDVDVAISLDCMQYYEQFIKLDFLEFLKIYGEQIPGFDSFTRHISHVYIGNQFCPLLCDIPNIEKIIEKVLGLGLSPVLVLSTMPENMTDSYRRILLSYVRNVSTDREIVVNDLGEAFLIKSMGIDARLSAGVLLNKRKKDFRTDRFNDANYTSDIDHEIYREYLKGLGIEKISYETCGYDIRVSRGGILHLPLYQMNTSTNCTLKSVCEFGDRGRQDMYTSCPHYCEDENIYFSKGIPAIGMFNSLFGYDSDGLNISKINEKVKEGIERLVVRF